MDAKQLLVCLFSIAVIGVVCYLVFVPASDVPPNPAVNEHTFVQIGEGMLEGDVAGLLGTPHKKRRGDRIRVDRPTKELPDFAIEETDNGQDIVHWYEGVHDEQIRLLFSAVNRRLIGGEYLIHRIPIYYRGCRHLSCRSAEMVEATGIKDWNPLTDQDKIARRATLLTFFASRIAQTTSPSTAPAPPPVASTPPPAVAPPPAVVEPSQVVPPPPVATGPSSVPVPDPVAVPPVAVGPGPNTVPSGPLPPSMWPLEWNPIRLPSGARLERAIVDLSRTWPTQMFPLRAAAVVGLYETDAIWAVVATKGGKPHGGAVTLSPEGRLSFMANFAQGELAGAVRIWNDQHQGAYYGEFTDGRKDGFVVLFEELRPVFVQEWKDGKLQSQHLITCRDGKLEPEKRGAAAAEQDTERTKKLEAMRADLEADLANTVEAWKALGRKDEKALAEKHHKLKMAKTMNSRQFESFWRNSLQTAQ